MTGLIKTIKQWTTVATNKEAPRTLDLGCGEGTFGQALFSNEADGFCGIDLSKRAIKLAARTWPDATWVFSNADRELPAADASVDRVVSLFGRRPANEIARVLKPTGTCLIAIPSEDDLIELREQTQQTGRRRSRWESVLDEFQGAGLRLMERKLWKERVDLEPDSIQDAMAMTYRAVRFSQKSRLEELDATKVTLAADLLRLQHA